MNFKTLHIIAASSRTRAELARIGFGLGYHAEVYANTRELAEIAPTNGIVLLEDAPAGGGRIDTVRAVQDVIAQHGAWLPVIALGDRPSAGRVVEAVKAGVMDYISLPIRVERLAASLKRIACEAEGFAKDRLRQIEATNRMGTLSPRESEVLDRMATGMSNKLIARDLDISPRTVEIHRANMLAKLNVEHSAAAIRLRIEAELTGASSRPVLRATPAARPPVPGHAPVAEIARMPAAT